VSITIVERDDEVIQYFKRYILPQFEYQEKVEIISFDAFEYAEKQMPGKDFDYAFIAHLNFAERARGLVLHSWADGRMGSGATSL